MIDVACSHEGEGTHPRLLEYFNWFKAAHRPPKRQKALYKNVHIYQQHDFKPFSMVAEVQLLYLHDCSKNCFNQLAMTELAMAERRRWLRELERATRPD